MNKENILKEFRILRESTPKFSDKEIEEAIKQTRLENLLKHVQAQEEVDWGEPLGKEFR